MISFRYFVVTLVSVFLALAVGIALGGGPLRGEVDNSLVKQVQVDRERKQALNARIGDLRAELRFTDKFATDTADALTAGALTDRSVALVQLPGANDRVASSMGALVESAGGTVDGTYRLSRQLLDPTEKNLVDQLGRQLSRGVQGVAAGGDSTAYERAGSLIGRAIGATGGAAETDTSATTILAGLSAADLMSSVGDPTGRADLVLVLAGPSRAAEVDSSGEGDILAALLTEMRRQVDGLVVAGPTSAAQGDGVVSALLADVNAARDLSTVDSVDLVTGQVVAVLALAEQAAGETGHYGAVDAANGAVPSVEGR